MREWSNPSAFAGTAGDAVEQSPADDAITRMHFSCKGNLNTWLHWVTIILSVQMLLKIT